ncbi:S8 family serine peptidase [Aliikangiella sp. G2MR2-5]|uniref:S8 family serine peptidase n=1 Tax=Aliikangiella sp. G2MR2-5 TaxID=2788943 RepID=UPI0018AA4290|nr:S8 family serine peptidase [Aliikangiella sp. G2MR2-5]
MKKIFKKTLVSSLVLAAASMSHIASASNEQNVIVKLKNPSASFSISASQKDTLNVSPQAFHQKQGKLRLANVKSFIQKNQIKPKHVYSNVYSGFSATLTQDQIDSLLKDPNVAAVYPDKIYNIYGASLNKNAPEQLKASKKSKAQKTTKRKRKLIDWPQVVPQGPADSGAMISSYRGNGQHVYVLDTGVDVNQNDIKDNLGLSYAPEFCHWPGDNKVCPMPFSDDHSHGTHVAGTILASDNDINALGMAPEATLHAVKVCSNVGSCPGSTILAGLNWAVFDMLGRGTASVANLSLGGPTDEDAGVCDENGYAGDNFIAESYCNAAHQGMVIVVAAGNDSDDASGYSPAGLDSTITVSAYSSYDPETGEAVYTNFSNYGVGSNTWSDRESGVITIAAPGESILSLNRTHATTRMSGTSMAAPAVAGAAALVLEKYPQAMDFSAMQNVRQLLVDNATIPAFYSTKPDSDGNELNFPHEEGLLNLLFLDDE